jgi:hypothetical protein
MAANINHKFVAAAASRNAAFIAGEWWNKLRWHTCLLLFELGPVLQNSTTDQIHFTIRNRSDSEQS